MCCTVMNVCKNIPWTTFVNEFQWIKSWLPCPTYTYKYFKIRCTMKFIHNTLKTQWHHLLFAGITTHFKLNIQNWESITEETHKQPLKVSLIILVGSKYFDTTAIFVLLVMVIWYYILLFLPTQKGKSISKQTRHFPYDLTLCNKIRFIFLQA